MPGLRIITPAAIASRRLAAHFEGLPAGMARCDLVQAIRKGAPRCGYSPTEVRRLVYLLQHTGDDDWRAGDGLPVVWKSVAVMARDLGVRRGQINAVERSLVDKGAIAHRDSGSRRRWGRRDPATGRVKEAYGVDLRPLAVAFETFAVAARASAADERMKQATRSESLSLRCEIRQMAAALGRECGLDGRPLAGTAALAALVAERDRLLAMRNALVAEFQSPGESDHRSAAHADASAHLRTCASAHEHSNEEGGGGEEHAGTADGRGGGYGLADAEGTQNRTPILIHTESAPNGNRPSRSGEGAEPAGGTFINAPGVAGRGDNGPGRNQAGHGVGEDGQRLQPDPAVGRETTSAAESSGPGDLLDAGKGHSRAGNGVAERPVPFPVWHRRLSRFCVVWPDGRLLVVRDRTGDRELRRALGRMKASGAIPGVLQEAVVHSPERISQVWRGQDVGPDATGGGRTPGRGNIDPERDFGVQHLQPGRVAAVASAAFRDLAGADPGWRDVRWACERQRLALGIHDTAWSRAVSVLGIRAAAVLVAVIDGRCRDKTSFVWNPSGFVVGCVKRAEAGGLHLHRSVWGLERTQQWRDARWAYAAPRSA